jgi:hypothetical protein
VALEREVLLSFLPQGGHLVTPLAQWQKGSWKARKIFHRNTPSKMQKNIDMYVNEAREMHALTSKRQIKEEFHDWVSDMGFFRSRDTKNFRAMEF